MTVVRILISLFVVLLIAVSIAGWVWTTSHQPPPQALASRIVLGAGIIAGVAGLAMIWRTPSPK